MLRRLQLVLFLVIGAGLAACHPGPADLASEVQGHGGGTIIDNGGNMITCAPVAGHDDPTTTKFVGDYTLDYVVTYDPRLGAVDDADGSSWEAHRARIEAFLAAKLPAALASFKNYADLLESGDDSKDRVWKASPLDLVTLDDQGLIEQLPANCMRPGPDGHPVPDLTQMVRRREMTTDTTRRIFYYYDYERFETLRRTQPLQFAYLVVHEWLWDFTDSPWINRLINHLIHSKQGAAMSPAAFAQYLKSLGISVDDAGRIGPQGPQEDALRHLFTAEPLCDYSQRFSVELMRYDRVNRVVLAPGESRDFNVKVPDDLLPSADWAACGFALMLTYGGTAAAAPFHLSLQRGVASFDRDLTAVVSDEPQQKYYAGLCHGDFGQLCIDRVGDLSQVLTPRNFQGSHWTMHVENTGGGDAGNVELLAPYFVFVKLRDP